MAKKRPKINGHNVIGFDEINNGFHLSTICDLNLPLVIPAYLYTNYPGSHYANEKNERKGGVFTIRGGRKDEDVVMRAVEYLSEHPDFLYSKIKEEETRKGSLIGLRSQAVTAMILRFFKDYNLRESNTFVCLDHLGADSSSEDLEVCIRTLLKEAELFQGKYENNLYFQHQADKFNQACKTADRVGYHILALRFRTDYKKWACRDRIVYHEKFVDHLIERATGIDLRERWIDDPEFSKNRKK